ncbi:antitoxin VapB family protein [Pyrodictium abyssi]|uniref:Putative antitoxin PABY_24020 n=1 Tax=Pyrodictium abyssi TaxID=54256 RepID=A0ABN6ZV08_9CREN|nr:antitoxin VapB family protein [Pyrodictium abyssi]
MARTITVSEEAYEALKRYKREGESFSQAILRLIEEAGRRRSLLSLAGAWSDMSDSEEEALLEEIRQAWRRWRVQSWTRTC